MLPLTPANQQHSEPKDFFIKKEGIHYAGTHLIIDLCEAENLDNLALTEEALLTAVQEADATLLHIHLHHFEPNGGISKLKVTPAAVISPPTPCIIMRDNRPCGPSTHSEAANGGAKPAKPWPFI